MQSLDGQESTSPGVPCGHAIAGSQAFWKCYRYTLYNLRLRDLKDQSRTPLCEGKPHKSPDNGIEVKFVLSSRSSPSVEAFR